MSYDVLLNFIKLVEEKDQKAGLKNETDSYAWEFLSIRVESEDLRESPEFSCTSGSKPANQKKNRYRDILPYDASRVKLTPYIEDENNDSDYINASYVNGALGKIAYVATQGPMVDTVNDFWQMIVECKSKTILMLCDLFEGGKSKCEQYWPDQGSTKQFGHTTVYNLSEKRPKDHYTERCLTLNHNGNVRDIKHFHYHGWPDHGTPDEIGPLLEFIDAVRVWQTDEEFEPIIVHCSAGCGRSGTYCALDYVRSQLKNNMISKDFDVRNLVMDFRKQRPAMVQSKDQYVLLYHAVAQMFKNKTTPVRPPRRPRQRVVLSSDAPGVTPSEAHELTKVASSSSVFTNSSNSRRSSPDRSDAKSCSINNENNLVIDRLSLNVMECNGGVDWCRRRNKPADDLDVPNKPPLTNGHISHGSSMPLLVVKDSSPVFNNFDENELSTNKPSPRRHKSENDSRQDTLIENTQDINGCDMAVEHL